VKKRRDAGLALVAVLWGLAVLSLIAAAMLYAHVFGDGDGHVVDIAAVPDWLEQRIGKTKRQNILHGFLTQVMVDSEDLRFVKAGGQRAVQSLSGFQVIDDRFLDDQPRVFQVAC